MNYTSQYEFTIIVPVYNEADNIEALGKRLKEFLPLSIYRACVLFVNDASNDGGLEMIKDICKRCNHFFYISFKENCGLSAALKAGIDFSESKYIGYIDADLQTIPEDFNILLLYAKNYPLVTGVRSDRQDSYFKKLQSKIGNGFRRMVTKDGAVDTGCPLKVIQKEYAKRIPLFTGMSVPIGRNSMHFYITDPECLTYFHFSVKKVGSCICVMQTTIYDLKGRTICCLQYLKRENSMHPQVLQ